MNLQKIERLIQKFERGETTLEEEMDLKIFFAKENVPFHLIGYKDLFSFYRKAVTEEIQDPDFDTRVLEAIAEMENEKPARGIVRKLYPFFGIAAGLILIVGLYFILMLQREPRDTFSDPEIAYAETKKILMKVSGTMNTGAKELANMKEINTGLKDLNNIKSFNDGIKKMNKISILDKSKDIITQKSNKQ